MPELTEEDKKRLREATAGSLETMKEGLTFSAPQPIEQPVEEPAMSPVAGDRVPRSFQVGGLMYGGGYSMPQPGGAGIPTQLFNRYIEAVGEASKTIREAPINLIKKTPTFVREALETYGKDMSGVSKPVVPTTEAFALTPEDVSGLSFNGSPLTMESITSPTIQAPAPQFEGSFLAPDGTAVGLLAGGGRKVMTPEEIAQFDAMNKAKDQVIGGVTPSMLPPEGMQRMMSGGEVMFADPTTAAAIGQRESERLFGQVEAPVGQIQTGQAGSPQAEFAARLASGEPLSQQEIAGYQAKASGMGTTFDPQRGYSRDPFLYSRAPTPTSMDLARRRDGGEQLGGIRQQAEKEVESLGYYRNIARSKGIGGSAQIAAAKELRSEAIDKRVQQMINQQKLQAEARGQAMAEQRIAEKDGAGKEAKEPTAFQKKVSEWSEREEFLRQDGVSPEEIAARRRAFLYGDKFDPWMFENNKEQPQRESTPVDSTGEWSIKKRG